MDREQPVGRAADPERRERRECDVALHARISKRLAQARVERRHGVSTGKPRFLALQGVERIGARAAA